MMGNERETGKGLKQRVRPANKQKMKRATGMSPHLRRAPSARRRADKTGAETELRHAIVDEQAEQVPGDKPLSAFSSLLRHILRQNRAEIIRVARELEVAENTVYRWMNGTSEPRIQHLKKLLEALPEHRRNLTHAINQTFPGVLDSPSRDLPGVHKDVYHRVLALRATTVEDDARRWHIRQTIFENALLHLDSERCGISITYAELMPAREGKIHSLYEVEVHGTNPWPFTPESKVYLGSTTLAGTAAMLQRMQTWDDLENTDRLQVIVDDFERSACAHPVMQAGRIAGVLVISSTQPGFFMNSVARQAVVEYAQLLTLALNESDFQPCSALHLRPMPDLNWQRAEMRRSYVNRVIDCARQYHLALPEAEQYIRREMEEEFELMERSRMEGLRQNEEAYLATSSQEL
jgi:transcriptional regulator with XRE-family HTH domain